MKMSVSSSDIESIDKSLSDIRDAGASDANKRLHLKTRKLYNKLYQDFINWKISKNRKSFKEKVLLEYFVDISKKYKASSLLSNFSILKITLKENHNVDISKYPTVNAFLKRKAEGYTGRKSKTFAPDDINKFLREAHDDEYLFAKVALIFGVVGGCRRQELYTLQFSDVEVLGSRILINLRRKGKSKIDRMFTLTGDYYELCKKYISLRPDPCTCTSFFIRYKSGECYPSSVGINHFGKIGKIIAKFIGLPNPDLYTGHCFKRTSTTMLFDSDGDIMPYNVNTRHKTRLGINEQEMESGLDDLVNKSPGDESKNINKVNTTLEDGTNNTIESIFQELRCPNSLESDNVGYINVDVPMPNLRESIDELPESKDEVWNELKISFSKESNDADNTTPGTSVKEDYLDDSTDDGDQMRSQNQNPLEDNTDRVININVPSTSNYLKAFSTLVCFNNCSIQNVNINNNNK